MLNGQYACHLVNIRVWQRLYRIIIQKFRDKWLFLFSFLKFTIKIYGGMLIAKILGWVGVGLVYLTKFLAPLVCSGAMSWLLNSLFWLNINSWPSRSFVYINQMFYSPVSTVGLCCDYYSRRHLGSWRGNEKECWGSGSWILSLESFLGWLFLDLEMLVSFFSFPF